MSTKKVAVIVMLTMTCGAFYALYVEQSGHAVAEAQEHPSSVEVPGDDVASVQFLVIGEG